MCSMAAELQPRLCCLTRGPAGYGFHLHGEKGRTGQYIRRVEPNSPAEAAGLRAGDRVIEVNGENVERESHQQVVQRIRAMEHETRLLVVDPVMDEHMRRLRLAGSGPNNGHVSLGQPSAGSPCPPSTKISEDPESLSERHYPRLCRLVKGEEGYGFNLHSDKRRTGQYVRSVDPSSPAERAGLQPKDRLIEVNGVNIEHLKHAEVVAIIKRGGDETQLLVVDPETDEYFKKQGITPTESHIKGFQAPSVTNSSWKSRPSSSSASQSSQSTCSELSSPDTSTQVPPEDDKRYLLDPFAENDLRLSPTAAEAREKARAKRAHKKAPPMDWNKKYEIFSNF
ncbi:Na(+)/H(+) exchange regulatory cofactor NHE-RF2-like [Arapaima gigas]